MSNTQQARIVIAAKPQPIRWPVTIKLLTDGGEQSAFQFDVWFARLTLPEGLQLDAEFPKLGDGATDWEYQQRDAELFSRILTGWSDNLVIEDAHGSPMPSGSQPERVAALHRLFESAEGGQFRLALWRAYTDWRSGQPALATKN
ncbi:hypothetical protein [Parachitinimonas caeni]|uniref:Uncharacterized protein n=1 Tax=Parachitinimonas caeni TaxID=3031301 RepID=A0ABT7DZB7_9NEIS|nr:hypothetical protein [Parachitinimonas caeni]MDK2124495.1 hypothetical protein [Parachitinimonas caeni]